MEIKKFRDLTLIDLNPEQLLVIGCDSCGGVGNKEQDVVKVPPLIVGYFTAFVALAEVIAYGGKPVCIVNNLSVEMEDTGRQIIEGIKRAVRPLGVLASQIITGSTEENFPICQTGMGITVIGVIDKANWQRPQTKKDALALVVGLPKVGEEVEIGDEEILSLSTLLKLKERQEIQEILPVGSKGILYELKTLAESNGLELELTDELVVDLGKTAGPATCAVISVDDEESYQSLKAEFRIPINRVGRFI